MTPIPVGDGLPPIGPTGESAAVLVYSRGHACWLCARLADFGPQPIALVDRFRWVFEEEHAEHDDADVSHWLPLPPPPLEG